MPLPYMTINRAAQILGVTPATAHRRVLLGHIREVPPEEHGIEWGRRKTIIVGAESVWALKERLGGDE